MKSVTQHFGGLLQNAPLGHLHGSCREFEAIGEIVFVFFSRCDGKKYLMEKESSIINRFRLERQLL